MANLTLIQAMTKTAELVYKKLKSNSGTNLSTKTDEAIGTLDGQTIYRHVKAGQQSLWNTNIENFTTPFSQVVKLELYVFIDSRLGVNLSNYVKIESGKISTTSDYPTRYSDPEFKYICIFEYVE